MYKVGDRVVFRGKLNHCRLKLGDLGTVVLWEKRELCVRWDNFPHYEDCEDELDCHDLIEEQVILLEVWNSPLAKVMSEEED